MEKAASRRPKDDPFLQQTLPKWQPIMTPFKVIMLFFAVGVAFVPTGISLYYNAKAVFEEKLTYDDGTTSTATNCQITQYNQNHGCNVTFTLDKGFDGPLYVYYELTNYYQNHRRYATSRNYYQLLGQDVSESELSTSCDPTTSVGNKTLNPCGLIANSFFNDVISLSSSAFTLNENDIAWSSDKDMFKQVDGFISEEVTCGTSTCPAGTFSKGCKFYTDNKVSPAKCYAYYYPNEDKVQYLYSTYPEAISPIEGVTNEHFIVWMRTAALPDFRKLYGKIEGSFSKGDVLTFNVKPYFDVNAFDGTKSIIITTNYSLGAKNPRLGIAYIVIGGICLLFGFSFALKQMLNPRDIGIGTMVRPDSKPQKSSSTFFLSFKSNKE